MYSSILDTIVRRTITLTFAQYPDLSLDAFTWLSLGSNGRREAVLSSDIDSAVAFRDDCDGAEIDRYRAAFADIQRELAAAGITADSHGATASRPAFSRTNAEWREAARQWMAEPVQNQGAMMTSLLVDGRPIHGDPGLPEVTEGVQRPAAASRHDAAAAGGVAVRAGQDRARSAISWPVATPSTSRRTRCCRSSTRPGGRRWPSARPRCRPPNGCRRPPGRRCCPTSTRTT